MRKFTTDHPGIIGIEVHRVRDAHGFLCLTCGDSRDVTSPTAWGWRKSQGLHERGTSHQTIMYRITTEQETTT